MAHSSRMTSLQRREQLIEVGRSLFAAKGFKKKMITDAELDMLIEYFKEKKKLLDEAAGKPFQSNGQTYYWISRDLLP